jgi:hypothetical protein
VNESAFLFVFGALAVVAIFWFGYMAKKRRQQAFLLLARQYGLQYSPEDPFGILNRPFALFRKGDGRGVENVLWGSWQGMPLHTFDYWYFEESSNSKGGRSKTYYRFSCAVTGIGAACSHVSIEKENLLTRLADMFALKDVQFESDEFNEAFNVKSMDREFTYAFVDARMMQWLLANGRDFTFEVNGDQILAACKRLDPAAMLPLWGTLQAFLAQVPRAVFSLYPRRR